MNIWVVPTSWLLWIMLLSTFVYKFLFKHLFPVLLGIRSAGSYGNFMSNYVRNWQSVFHSGCIILHPYQQCMKVSISPHPHQHLIFYGFLKNYSHRPSVIAVLICTYLVTNDVECLFMCLLVICIFSFFEEMSTQVLHSFFNWVVCPFFCWVVRVLHIFRYFLYIWIHISY